MAQTYDPAALMPVSLTLLAWARNQVRLLLRDKPNAHGVWAPNSLDDSEIEVSLEQNAVVVEGVTYYRPHETAAQLLESDPERVLSYSGTGWGENYRDPAAVAVSIRASGRRFDALIPTPAGVTQSVGPKINHVRSEVQW
jgi:hypothetical protein